MQPAQKRLAEVKVMIIDPDARLTEVIYRVLKGFGFQKVMAVRSGKRAISLMERETIDLLICEWDMEEMSGLEVIEAIRSNKTPCPRDLPIIMLTGQSEQHHVLSARDTGVTEYLIKPFTAKTLSHRLIQVIDNPRLFVQSGRFIGPDRRRRKNNPEDTDPENRKLTSEQMLRLSERMPDGRMRFRSDSSTVFFTAPNKKIRELIGEEYPSKDIFSAEAIQRAQQVLYESKDSFVKWIIEDLDALEKAYAQLEKNQRDIGATVRIQQLAFNVMSQSGSFNFPLGSQVGKLLHDYVRDAQSANLLVIRKHIDTLYIIFEKRMEGEDQKVHSEVIAMLTSLIRKIG